MSQASNRPHIQKAPLDYPRRLHHRREFLEFFSGSDVYRFGSLSVFRKRNALGHFRLGVTFKARMGSVERNAIRRRIRETFRNLGPQLGSHDYNVVIQKLERPAVPFARRLTQELQTSLLSQQPQPVHSRRTGQKSGAR